MIQSPQLVRHCARAIRHETLTRFIIVIIIFRHVFFKAIPVCFSLLGNHPANLFVDCYFDIILNKHSTMITKTWDDLSLDDKTVIVRYKQA